MLGQPMSMLIPQVLGVRLHGELPEGATATDLVLTVTELLRERGVVGMFVEFYGAGLAGLPIADRATIGNMSPEFGSTCAIFPIDAETLDYLRALRPPAGADRARRGLRQGAGPVARRATPSSRPSPRRSSSTWRTVEPSLAGPKRPQDRVPLSAGAGAPSARRCARLRARQLADARDEAVAESFPSSDPPANGNDAPAPRADGGPSYVDAAAAPRRRDGASRDRGDGARSPTAASVELDHGHVVIAAITSCTNTSNPSVMIGAGMLARNARRARPALQAVGEDLARARLEGRHRVPRPRRPDRAAGGARLQPRRLRLHDLHRQLRPAPPEISAGRRRRRPGGRLGAVGQPQLRGAHQPRREDELPRLAARCASPTRSPARWTSTSSATRSARTSRAATSICATSGRPQQEVAQTIGAGRARGHVPQELRRGVRRRRALERPAGARRRALRAGTSDSTYVRLPPYFKDMPAEPAPVARHRAARACWRCSATASPPTTSPRRARSSATARRAPTCRSTAWRRGTSTPTARAAATTR